MPHAPRTLPRPRMRAAAIALLLAGCVPAITLDEPASDEELATDETRSVELRFLRLDAKNFEQVLTKADIKKKFPERILRETWLLDMDLGPMITNALDALVATPAEEAYTLPASSRNMWKLLNMTPANTVLTGSSLAPLLGVGKAVGLARQAIDLARGARWAEAQALADRAATLHPRLPRARVVQIVTTLALGRMSLADGALNLQALAVRGNEEASAVWRLAGELLRVAKLHSLAERLAVDARRAAEDAAIFGLSDGQPPSERALSPSLPPASTASVIPRARPGEMG